MRLGTASRAATTMLVLAACRGPAVPHPVTSQFRYLCCNLHYDKREITDMNYLRGKVIPFGSRVQILAVGEDRVEFEAPGEQPITLVLQYGAERMSMDEYLDRIFLVDDPYTRLPKLPPDAKRAREVDRTRRLVEEGTISVGMTRAEVLMAIGYPPAHRTPSLDASPWRYWVDPSDTFDVYFDGDVVSHMDRQGTHSTGRRRRRG
jgi:hypothetical protein